LTRKTGKVGGMGAETSGNELFAGVFARGAVARQVSAQAWLAALLGVEAALARAAARAGLVSAQAAEQVSSAALAGGFELALLGEACADTGNPVPELVKLLSARVPEAARAAVHIGATSQDIVDSALMLLAKRACTTIAEDLTGAADAAAQLAERHRATLMPGRTLLQQALPIPFGLKAAGWLDGLTHARTRLAQLSRGGALLQFGGAAGTLAALGERGPELSRLLAEELGLREPPLPWHTMRQPLLEWSSALTLAGAAAGKIARDLSLLAQTEVGEVSEGAARGGSSSMPHKQNPVAAVAVLACTRRLPGLSATLLACAEQEHERAAGAWHAEWETFSELLRLTGSAAAWLREALGGLEVNAARMRANLDAGGGLPLAERLAVLLTPALGRLPAQALVKQAVARAREQGRPLRDVLLQDAVFAGPLQQAGLAATTLDRALDPATYLGSSEIFIDRALAAHAASKGTA
jgi:3-carboxy-cis,cis-muconate cycloisomerase